MSMAMAVLSARRRTHSTDDSAVPQKSSRIVRGFLPRNVSNVSSMKSSSNSGFCTESW